MFSLVIPFCRFTLFQKLIKPKHKKSRKITLFKSQISPKFKKHLTSMATHDLVAKANILWSVTREVDVAGDVQVF
jgi:hypothetical protein